MIRSTHLRLALSAAPEAVIATAPGAGHARADDSTVTAAHAAQAPAATPGLLAQSTTVETTRNAESADHPGDATRRLRSTLVGAVLAVAVTGAGVVMAPSSEAAAPSTPSRVARTSVALANRAGFSDVSVSHLVKTSPITAVPLTPALVVTLQPTTDGSAFSSQGVTINGPASDGSSTVVKLGGLGVVTNRHAKVEYRYKTYMAPGTTLVKAADGSLNQLTGSGERVGHIDAAYAIDSTGKSFPASYSYDSAAREFVVKADTTTAKGEVFVDPSWRCWAVASAYGIGWIVTAAAWVFTDGTAVWAAWALRAWFGVSYNAADAVARACALN